MIKLRDAKCPRCREPATKNVVDDCGDPNCPLKPGELKIMAGICEHCNRDFQRYPLGKCIHKTCPHGAYDPNFSWDEERPPPQRVASDGSTASYYELPEYATELQHLISHKNMNGQVAEIFRTCYRFGESSHSDELREAKKMQFYANAEIERLERLIST